ncbi:MAE_28990/MAE_18760 family HEPN-like nuclease [Vibrio jasicida]|uniref:MAE_28990/MAE_18760 family HEPN-like nuclease n=1 Tax=Vibrio jasicida TaxID=766224 RepID=UPI0003A4B69E|nr:MAE_28990/MAE_18760 family HEPN-like nuclease [Vibrio jasicida]
MAKKFNLQDFVSTIEGDLLWRKKEISDLIVLRNGENDFLVSKSVILMLYSHWEGYIKNASKAYIYYISSLKLPLNKLTTNFEAIALKNELNLAKSSAEKMRIDCDITLVNDFYERLNDTFTVPSEILQERNKKFINTHDNLNIEHFNHIMRIVGIGNLDAISNRANYIDEQLLHQRNTISHGTKINPKNPGFNLSIPQVKTLRDFIVLLMEFVRDELIYYSEEELYLFNNMAKAEIRRDKSTTNLENNLKTLFEE